MLGIANSYVSTSNGWYRLWFSLAALAALVTTFVDVVLLQRKYNIFTGGFLSSDHLRVPVEIILFLATSFIADVGLTLPLSGITLWVATRRHFNAKPSFLAVLLIAIAPILTWTFFAYQLRTYLGQAVDVALTYVLSGQSVFEIVAFAAPHLSAPLITLAGGAVLAIAAIWLYKRLLPEWKELPAAPPLGRLSVQSVIMILAAMLVTCVAYVGNDVFQDGLRPKLAGRLFAAVGETITDVDLDGYGLLRQPSDPAPLDPLVFPYAVDVPGNGIDENGVAGDFPVGIAHGAEDARVAKKWAFTPNFILILLESFRADLVGATHEGRPVTPVLSQLIAEGGSAPLAFSHVGFTAPSRYHLFSGNLLGALDAATLIDDFKRNGYEVAYFSAQDVLFGGPRFDIGYSRADEAYDAQVEPDRRFSTFATPGSIGLPYQVIIEKVTKFLEGRKQDRPLFLYVNFQDTHFPYHHRRLRELVSAAALPRTEISPDHAAELWATYVNAAANVDLAVGEVVETVKRFLKDPTPAVVVTSDHGESLYDDGFLGHGIVLNDIQTSVPLVVANLPVIIEQPFGLADFRDAIQRTLEHEPPTDLRPTFSESPDRKVFQHLGRFERPRQIALRGLSGRAIYDFRTGRFKASNGSWQRPHELSEFNAEAFRALIHEWERQVLAAQAAGSQKPNE